MSNVSTPRAAFGRLLLNEARLAWRVPVSLGLGLGLPIVLMIIFGSIPDLRKATPQLGGLSYFSVSFPILIGTTVLSLSSLAIPRSLVAYRETGILRRLSTTPVPPAWLLVAQVIINLLLIVVGLTLLTASGIMFFGLSAPKDWFGFLLGIALTVTSLFAVGLWVAAIARNNASASGIGGLLFYAMLFLGGMWIPREIMPTILKNISDWTPMGASVGIIQNAMQGLSSPRHFFLALAGYSVVFGYLAVRYFRWE